MIIWATLAKHMGIDYHQYRHLLIASIRMDFRSNNWQPGHGRPSAIPPLLINLSAYSLFSLLILFVMIANFRLGILLSILFTMVSLSLVIMIEFGATIINPYDFQIIGARPVSSRTYFAVKLSNLMFFVSLYTLALNILPALAGAFSPGSAVYYPAIHMAATLLAAFFTAGSLAMVYGVMLKLFNPERFKDIITYCQIVLSIIIFSGYQLIPRWLSDIRDMEAFSSFWLMLAPPIWFFRIVDLGLGKYSVGNVAGTLIGLTATTLVCTGLLSSLSLNYAEHIARLMVTRREKPPKERTGWAMRLKARLQQRLLPNPQERAIFGLIVQMFRRSRFIKQQFYPNIGMNLAIFAVNLFGNTGADPYAPGAGRFSFALFVPMITFMILTNAVFSLIPYSDEYSGRWIFDVAPLVNKRQIVTSVKKAILVFFFPATFLLNFLLFAYYWPIGDALYHAGFGLIVGLVFLQIGAFFLPALPFTRSATKGSTSANALLTSLVMVFCTIVFVVLQVLSLRWQGLTGFFALSAGLLTLAAILNARSNAAFAQKSLFSSEREGVF
ncbi:MAG: hypothetical protein HYR55_13755 [Acidobacteria bacterium]|nr:hypothetical protein [Acidobacteriota bacterium]MBI3656644.1 hypothetical protein [Acidobacteriota bacterium]